MAYHIKNTEETVEYLNQLGFVPYSDTTIERYSHFRIRFDSLFYSGAYIATESELISLDTLKEISIMPSDEIRELYLVALSNEGRQ